MLDIGEVAKRSGLPT
ncbi:MAG: hypothetical protein P8Y45_16870, partial [Exilibacterium sp.]